MKLFRALFFTVLLATVPALQAQKRPLSRPLTYLPADSVFTLGQDCSNFRAAAASVHPAILPRDFRWPDSDFKRLLKDWEKECAGGKTGQPAEEEKKADTRIERELHIQDKAAALFLHTGHREYTDRMEYGIYNEVWHDVRTLSPGMSKSLAAHLLADATGRIYALTDSSIWVNLFANSTARIPYKGYTLILDQITAMPFDGRVRLRLTGIPQGGIPLRLYVRIPSWAEKNGKTGGGQTANMSAKRLPPFFINGREPLRYEAEGGYVSVSRQWRNGDEFLLELPTAPRYVSLPHKGTSRETVSVYGGPLLYVANDGIKDDGGNSLPALPPLASLQANADEEGYPFYEGTYASGIPFSLHPYAITSGRTRFARPDP